jgi:hypothetical protein
MLNIARCHAVQRSRLHSAGPRPRPCCRSCPCLRPRRQPLQAPAPRTLALSGNGCVEPASGSRPCALSSQLLATHGSRCSSRGGGDRSRRKEAHIHHTLYTHTTSPCRAAAARQPVRSEWSWGLRSHRGSDGRADRARPTGPASASTTHDALVRGYTVLLMRDYRNRWLQAHGRRRA